MSKSDNPWHRLSTRYLENNYWFRLRKDHVLHRSGGEHDYYVIEARPALGIVALTDQMEIILVGQYRYPLDLYSWEIPEGGGEPGETLLDGARRELGEETGYQAEQWEELGVVHTSNAFTNETGTIFLARSLIAGKPHPDDTEELTVKQLPLSQALEMVNQNQITDAISVAGIYKVAARFRTQF